MALTSFTIVRNPLTESSDNLQYILGWGKGGDGNAGTINSPKATLLGGINILRGKVSFSNVFSQSATLIGEQDAEIDGSVGGYGLIFSFYNLKAKALVGASSRVDIINCEVNTLAVNPGGQASYGVVNANNVLIHNLLFYSGKRDLTEYRNCTILAFKNYLVSSFNEVHDSIVAGNFDLYNHADNWSYYPVFKNSLFIKELFKPMWNGVEIPITWTALGNEIQDIIDSLYAYADNHVSDASHKAYLKLCADNLFGDGCVIHDTNTIPVFNPGTFTLNRQNGNPALFISSDMDYVGAYRPALQIDWDFSNIKNIDVNGNEIAGVPADLMGNNNGVFANVDSNQLRNRVESTGVIEFSNGDGFSKLAGELRSAAPNGWYFGPWRTLNTINPVIPFDAIELEIYDTVTELSEYPKIAIPFNRDCEIYFHKTGARAGKQVLFNDLAGLGIETNVNLIEYGDWAVTNAGAECVDLQNDANIEARKPLFRHVKLRLTLNRTQ